MTQSEYFAQIRATRAELIQERDDLEQKLLAAKTRAKYDYIYKKGERLTQRIHFLSEELGELCPDCGH